MQAFMRLETLEQNARIGFMLAQLGMRNPLPADEVEKLLRQREKMGLSHEGERDAFCQVCGTCHSASQPHLPTMRLGETTLPSQTSTLNNTELRALVAQVVQKTLGS
jgi:hypothetical protein